MFLFPLPSVFLSQRWPKCFRNNIVNWSSLNNSTVAWSDNKKRTTHLINQPELKALWFVKMFICPAFQRSEIVFWSTFFTPHLDFAYSGRTPSCPATCGLSMWVVSVKQIFFRNIRDCTFSTIVNPSLYPHCSCLVVLCHSCCLVFPAKGLQGILASKPLLQQELLQELLESLMAFLDHCHLTQEINLFGAPDVCLLEQWEVTLPFHRCFCFSLNKRIFKVLLVCVLELCYLKQI